MQPCGIDVRLRLEYAVMHEDEAEAARLRAELAKPVEKV